MSNDLTRLQSRFLGEPARVEEAKAKIGAKLDGPDAEALGLVTFALDDIDWDDEVRVFIEERAELLARRADRHGSEPALRRARRRWRPRSSRG